MDVLDLPTFFPDTRDSCTVSPDTLASGRFTVSPILCHFFPDFRSFSLFWHIQTRPFPSDSLTKPPTNCAVPRNEGCLFHLFLFLVLDFLGASPLFWLCCAPCSRWLFLRSESLIVSHVEIQRLFALSPFSWTFLLQISLLFFFS